jgi:hypothetical protein
MSKKLDIAEAMAEGGVGAAREPMFSPVFLSPGGSFRKAQKVGT